MSLKFEKITRPAMRGLEPGEEINEHNIRYKKLRNGDGRFTIDLKVNKRRIHRVIGFDSDGMTKEKVLEVIEQIKTDARNERLNLPTKRKTPMTFKEAALEYLSKQKASGGKNLKAKERHLAHVPKPENPPCDYLRQFFGMMSLSQITTFDIDRYKKWRKDSKATHGTINRELATLSHLLACAVEWQWIPKKPGTIKKLKEENQRIVYLSAEQVKRLKDEARLDDNSQLYPFILIGLETGMRMMEILSIRLEDIHLKDRQIYIPEAKAGAAIQPITPNLAEYLAWHLKQNCKEGQVWLFPSRKSKTGHTVNITKSYRRVVKKAGFDPNEIVRHTLRHTAITHLVQSGVDLPTVKKISRHKTTQMVERYAHQNNEHIRQAMEKLEQKYQVKPLLEVAR